MSSSTIIRAAFFAVGAIVGGGVATAVSTRNKQVPALGQSQTSPPPIIQVGKSGATTVSLPDNALQADLPVLRYGNPGKAILFGSFVKVVLTLHEGPLSDQLVRKAYVAGYDRRLRHPAWVRSLNHLDYFIVLKPVDS